MAVMALTKDAADFIRTAIADIRGRSQTGTYFLNEVLAQGIAQLAGAAFGSGAAGLIRAKEADTAGRAVDAAIGDASIGAFVGGEGMLADFP
jgi:hypothetical protein